MLLPAIKQAGIDPAYFGVVFIMVTVMGLLTPPVGTVLNVACGAGKINMERIVKAVWPFLLAEAIILLLMVLFPALVSVPMNSSSAAEPTESPFSLKQNAPALTVSAGAVLLYSTK